MVISLDKVISIKFTEFLSFTLQFSPKSWKFFWRNLKIFPKIKELSKPQIL